MRAGTFGAMLAAATMLAGPAAAQSAGIPVGTVVAPMTIKDLDGRPVDLGTVIGKRPVLLEFWATWCGNCEELMPAVREAQRQFGKEVEFLGVNVTVNQTPARVRRYLEEHKPPFRTLYDSEGVGARAFKVPATAYVVVLDRTGKVAYTGLGPDQDLVAVLRKVAGS